jgi:transposase
LQKVEQPVKAPVSDSGMCLCCHNGLGTIGDPKSSESEHFEIVSAIANCDASIQAHAEFTTHPL